jgi:hypothetical protein
MFSWKKFLLSPFEGTSTVKRLKVMYKRPRNITLLVTYYLAVIHNLQKDNLFASIADLLNKAETQVKKLEAAEVKVLGKFLGSTAERRKEFIATEIIMDQVLNKVQQAGDNDLENSEYIFTRNLLKIRTRAHHDRDEQEVKHGKVPGTFKARNRPVSRWAAYFWMISEDGVNWQWANFSKNSSCKITNIGEEPLTIGTLYYIRSMSHSSKGYSGWSQVTEIYCI